MAIFHLSAKTISRSQGRSATAAAAYRAGEKIKDLRTGEEHDYRKKQGVKSTAIFAPYGAPEWAKNRASLWNEAEAAEKRKDAQVAREVVVALPEELDEEAREGLLHSFVLNSFVRRGMVADCAIHAPNAKGDQRNHHAHILLATREISSEGFGKKNREWNSKELLQQWRKEWAEETNLYLKLAQKSARVTHQSFKAQGLPFEAQTHEGHAVTSMRRRGVVTEVGSENDRRQAQNARILNLIDQKTAVFTDKLKGREQEILQEERARERARERRRIEYLKEQERARAREARRRSQDQGMSR